MGIFWKPYGNLDVSTDPSQLPQSVDSSGNSIESGALTRCKNLRLNQEGVAKTRDGSTKLNETAMAVAIGHIVEQGGNRYSMGTIIYRDEVSIGTGYASAAWSSIRYNAFNSTQQNIFALNGSDRIRVYGSTVYQWGITAPAAAPVAAIGTATGLTGAYSAKISYCRKEGSTVVSESNLSPASNTVNLTDDKLSVTWTDPTDSQITHIRLYRTLAGGLVYFFDQDIAIGVGTIASSTADSALGSLGPTDHDRPPAGTAVIGPNYDGACFILKSNLVHFCAAKQPEYWPPTYYVEAGSIDFPLQAGCFWNGQLYVASKHEIYQIAGTGPQTYFPIAQSALTGARGRYCMLPVKGYGVVHVGLDGLYLFNTASDIKLTQGQFDKIFQGETAGAMPGVGSLDDAWLIQYQNLLYFGYAAATNTYPRHVIVMDLTNKKAVYYDWGQEIPAMCVDHTNERLLGVDSAGYVRYLENPNVTTDDGTAIDWDIQSKDFTLSTRAHFPRWNKYDVDASAATSAQGALMLDDAALHTHILTGTRSTRRRLVETGNGQRCAIRLYGSGLVSIYAVESE